jgi:D-alanyl-D-alanine carboxypeptidase
MLLVMKKLCLTVLVVISLVQTMGAQINPAQEARFQFVLDSVCAKYNIKGASAAVLMPGEGIWKGVSGLSEDGVPVTPDMLFGIGSNTKSYMAAIMLRMQEQGLIDLDDTIGTWIQNQPNISGSIAIRQLLNHSSGIYNYTNSQPFNAALGSDWNAIWQPEDILPYVEAPSFAAGTSWEYSNTNYLLAGMIIKEVLNQPLAAVLNDYILQPQGFNHTFLFPEETPADPIVHYWSIFFSQPAHLQDLIVEYSHSMNAGFSMAGAAGAILSTAEDNVKFWNSLMTGQIIDTNSLQEMKQFITLSNSRAYGLGLFKYTHLNGHIGFGHGGSNVGFFNENFYDPANGVCISVLTNQDSVTNNMIFQKVIGALHKEVLQPVTAVWNTKAARELKLSMFPNPANDNLNLSVDDYESYKAQLVDIAGRVLTEADFSQRLSVDVSTFAAGVYQLLILDWQGRKLGMRKVVVKRD